MPYTVQCRSYSKKTVNQFYIYSTVLGAAIKCKQYIEIAVETRHNIQCKNYLEYICSVDKLDIYQKEIKGLEKSFLAWMPMNN